MKISIAKKDLTESDGKLATEISDLNIPNGIFPEAIYVYDGPCGETEDFLFFGNFYDAEHELVSVNYRNNRGVELIVFND